KGRKWVVSRAWLMPGRVQSTSAAPIHVVFFIVHLLAVFWVSLCPTAEDQRGIDPTESEIVVHHKFVLHGPRRIDQIIQLAAAWVDAVQVQRMDIAILVHHLDAEPGL